MSLFSALPIRTRQVGDHLEPRDVSGLTIPAPPLPWDTLRASAEMAVWAEPTPTQHRNWWLRFWRIVR
jgi:hypothetical protein